MWFLVDAVSLLHGCVGARYAGAALNPALVLAPAIVFRCNRDWWVYLLAELLGSVLAAGVSVSIMCYGASRRMKHGPKVPSAEGTREPLLAEEALPRSGPGGLPRSSDHLRPSSEEPAVV